MPKGLNCELWRLVFSGATNATYFCDDDEMSVWFDDKRQCAVLTFRGSKDVAEDGFTPVDSKPVNMSLQGTSYSIHLRAHR